MSHPFSTQENEMIEALEEHTAAEQERAVIAKLTDAETPGARVGFDPAEAERAGAFIETGLSDADAAAAEDGDGE